VTDRADCFLAHRTQEYFQKNKIEHHPTTPYHPEANGQAEREIQEIKRQLRFLAADNLLEWDRHVARAVFNLNVRHHTTTGYSPFFLVFGCEPILPFSDERPSILDARLDAQWTMEQLEDDINRRHGLVGQARVGAVRRIMAQQKKMKEQHENTDFAPFEYGETVTLPNEAATSFAPRRLGPYIIIGFGPEGTNTYLLQKVNGEIIDAQHHNRLKKYLARDLLPSEGHAFTSYYGPNQFRWAAPFPQGGGVSQTPPN
jgi:hypothetical protein